MLKKEWAEKKILLVEDEETNIILIQEFLSITQIRIDVSKNGKNAVERIEAGEKFDLVLMDIKMPVMNGLEATVRIKNINPAIPIIAQTAYALAEEREQALEVGCDDYITKPIRREDLIALMAKYIEQ
ncbi:MAG: response regulator [Prolixibacteraceae bacterium]|jgi:CheY-like chemotaxis protein|nr:response regulator [Prolixibacteraceae bacterium]